MNNTNQQMQSSKLPQQSQPVDPSTGPSKVFLLALVIVLLLGVGVDAYFLGIKNSQPISQPIIRPVAKPSIAPNPTANWKTYIDTKNSFQFKYPPNWFQFILQNKILQKSYIAFSNESVSTYDQLSNHGVIIIVSTQNVKITTPGWQHVKIGEKDALRKSLVTIATPYDPSNADVVVFNNEGVAVSLGSRYMIALQSNEKIFDQILSTFTFTDQNQTGDTSNWKTTVNRSAGYLIKYPQSWETYVYDKQPKDEPIDYAGERFFRPIGQDGFAITIRPHLISNYAYDELSIIGFCANSNTSYIHVSEGKGIEVKGFQWQYLNGIRIPNLINKCVVAQIRNDKYVIEIQNGNNDGEAIFDQMLSTFTFTQ